MPTAATSCLLLTRSESRGWEQVGTRRSWHGFKGTQKPITGPEQLCHVSVATSALRWLLPELPHTPFPPHPCATRQPGATQTPTWQGGQEGEQKRSLQ